MPGERLVVLKNILFATDFSPSSLSAFPHAESIARRYGAKLYVSHVIPPEAYILVPPDKRDTALRQAKEYGEERLGALTQASNLSDVPHELLLDHGDVWPILSEIVEKQDIDLIVIGTHGRRGIQKVLLGSVAEEIFRLATCPVLTVGPRVDARTSTEIKLRRILYPTDFSKESVAALDCAMSLAEEYEANLMMLHVTQKISEEPIQARIKEFDFFRKHLPRSELYSGLRAVEFLIRFGSPATCVLEAASEQQADLIVLGVRGHKRVVARVLRHLPGPTASGVVAGARCPVLTVPSELS